MVEVIPNEEKNTAALLAAVILLTLAGCANNKADAPAPDTTRPTVTATVETTGTAESDTDTEHTEERKTALPRKQSLLKRLNPRAVRIRNRAD